MKDLVVGALISVVLFWVPQKVGHTSFEAGDLGLVKIFKKPEDITKKYVILISEISGWNSKYDELAYEIAEDKNVVIGVDLSLYTKKEKLLNHDLDSLAQHIEKIGKSVQQLLAEKEFKPTTVIVVKDSYGITSFLGTKSSSDLLESVNAVNGCFDPRLALKQDNHRLNKLVRLFADERAVCPQLMTWSQEQNIPLSKVKDLANNPANKKYWTSDMKNIWRLNSRTPASLGSAKNSYAEPLIDNLPLIIIEPSEVKSDRFVILYSGDGGWSEFTQELASEYQSRGIPVIGINSLYYFWFAKKPEGAAKDIENISHYFSKQWKLKEFDLVGFSFGAEVIPGIINQLSKKTQQLIHQAVMIAPGNNVKFEFNISDWFDNADSGASIRDEVLKVKSVKIKCIYGDEDRPGVCSKFPTPEAAYKLKGGHHFNDDFDQFKTILW